MFGITQKNCVKDKGRWKTEEKVFEEAYEGQNKVEKVGKSL